MEAVEPVTLGVFLRRRRLAAGLTQEALAKRAGLTAQGIAAIERGRRRRPHFRTVQAIAAALELSDGERASLMALISGEMSVPDRPLGAFRSVLHTPATPVIGRDQAVERLLDLLRNDHVRLITLTGPGGVGKTTLALEVARQAEPLFPDGVIVVPLDVLDDPELALSRIAASVGLTGIPRHAELEVLHGWFDGRRVLLVLDNFEHLLPASDHVAALLDQNPGLSIVVTSRAPMRLRSEREFPVSTLEVPLVVRTSSPDDIAATDAVRLLVDRVQAVNPQFALSEENAPIILEICRRLDGLPLAIELAAARLRVLSPADLLTRLDRSMSTLAGGARDLPERQRTMRQTIEWSYRLLEPDERTLLRHLSVWIGGWDVKAVSAFEASDDALSRLFAVVEHSLVTVEVTDDGSARYRMLETIRQFGIEHLQATGELESARGAHLAWCLALAEAADAESRGPQQSQWLHRLESEHGNLNAALSWAVETSDVRRREEALRLAAALWTFWFLRGHVVEGETWFQRVLAVAAPHPTEHRARAMFGLGMLKTVLGELDAAAATLGECLEMSRLVGSRSVEALAEFGLGDAMRMQGDHDTAEQHYQAALALFREQGETAWAGNALNGRAVVAFKTGDLDRAEELALEGLRLLRESGDIRNIAEATVILGQVASLRHQTVRAATLLREGLEAFWTLHDVLAVLQILGSLASIAVDQGKLEQAVRVFAGASARHDELLQQRGKKFFVTMKTQILPGVCAELGYARFDHAWNAGTALDIDNAVSEGLSLAETIANGKSDLRVEVSTNERVATLSKREREVVRLVALGMTNGEVADQLFLSRRTVEAHLRRIYAKLDLPTRSALVRFSLQHGID